MKTNKTNYINLLSVISCVAVVVLHTNGCFWNFSTEKYWKTANIIECLFYFAVPCFFMISGAMLIDYRERYSTRKFFVKRIQKTVIPFLIWSIVGFFYSGWILNSINMRTVSIVSLYNGVMSTSFVSIYWFFPSLFCVYLSIPLFAAVDKKVRKEAFLYLAIVGFLINFVVPLIKTVLIPDMVWPISLSVVSGNMIYVVIGYLLNEYELSKKTKNWVYVFALIGFFIHLVGTYYVSMQAGEVLRTFKGYASAPCIMYSVGVYVWIKSNAEKILDVDCIRKGVELIGPYTFGIYLLQWFIYKGMLHFIDIDVKSMAYRLGAPIIIIPMAICMLKILKKSPILRHIVP